MRISDWSSDVCSSDLVVATLGIELSRESSGLDLLRRPELDYAKLTSVAAFAPAADDPAVAEQVEIEAKYSGYLERQREEIARAQRHEGMAIPDGFDYAAVRGLSAEARQKFERVRPQTVGQAQRIPGVTPARSEEHTSELQSLMRISYAAFCFIQITKP